MASVCAADKPPPDGSRPCCPTKAPPHGWRDRYGPQPRKGHKALAFSAVPANPTSSATEDHPGRPMWGLFKFWRQTHFSGSPRGRDGPQDPGQITRKNHGRSPLAVPSGPSAPAKAPQCTIAAAPGMQEALPHSAYGNPSPQTRPPPPREICLLFRINRLREKDPAT